MTGKELLLVLGGSIMAGGATAGVVALQAADDGNRGADTAKIDARLERIENVLERTAESIRRNHGKLSDLGERMTGVEMQAANAVRAASGHGSKRVVRTDGMTVDQDVEVDWDHEGIDVEGAGLDPAQIEKITQRLKGEMKDLPPFRVGGLRGPDGEPMEGRIVQLGAAVDSLRKGLELRRLPENERWDKAQEDLGLDYNQVEDLKRAVSTRDQAMQNAMVTDRDEETENGRFTIKRLDGAKAAKAQSDYQDTVKKTLDEGQRKDWRRKGYDRAFGSRGGGNVSIMTIGTMVTDTKKTTESDSNE